MVRRYLAKNPGQASKVHNIFAFYHNNKYEGTLQHASPLSSLKPAPPPGARGRKQHKTSQPMYGPIGLLLQQLHFSRAAYDVADGTIRAHGHVPTHLMHTTMQAFRSNLFHIAIVSRNMYAATVRTALKDTQHVSIDVFQPNLASQDFLNSSFLDSVATGQQF